MLAGSNRQKTWRGSSAPPTASYGTTTWGCGSTTAWVPQTDFGRDLRSTRWGWGSWRLAVEDTAMLGTRVALHLDLFCNLSHLISERGFSVNETCSWRVGAKNPTWKTSLEKFLYLFPGKHEQPIGMETHKNFLFGETGNKLRMFCVLNQRWLVRCESFRRESRALPPAAPTRQEVFQGCRYRWSHPGRSSFCTGCSPGAGLLTAERKS